MTRRPTGDQGTSLLFVLAFTALCSVLCLAVLTITQANFTTTSAVREVRDQNYAGDAAIELGIAKLKADVTLGATAASCQFPLTGLNGQTAAVRCTPVTTVGGPGSRRPSNALLALGTASTEGVLVRGNSLLAIRGNVYSHSIITLGQAQSAVAVTGSLLAQGQGDCADARITATVAKACGSAGNATGADPSWPNRAGTTFAAAPALNPAPLCTNRGPLRLATFVPGKYTKTVAELLVSGGPLCTGTARTTLHFTPGLVYFEDVSVDFEKYDVVTGTAGTWLAAGTRPTGEAACLASSAGTQVLLGGTSVLRIDDDFTTLALCSGPADSDGVAIALYGVKTTGSGLKAQSGAALTATALDFDRNKPKVFVHGSVYFPLSAIAIRMHNRSETVYDRGIVARSIVVDVSASSTQLDSPISLPDCVPSDPCVPTARKFLFTATVDGVDRVRSLVDFPVVGVPDVETYVVLR